MQRDIAGGPGPTERPGKPGGTQDVEPLERSKYPTEAERSDHSWVSMLLLHIPSLLAT